MAAPTEAMRTILDGQVNTMFHPIGLMRGGKFHADMMIALDRFDKAGDTDTKRQVLQTIQTLIKNIERDVPSDILVQSDAFLNLRNEAFTFTRQERANLDASTTHAASGQTLSEIIEHMPPDKARSLMEILAKGKRGFEVQKELATLYDASDKSPEAVISGAS